MQGDIAVESEEGAGSTFHFAVPLVIDSATDAVSASAQAETAPLHLLLVEDNAVNQDYIATLLRKAGHTVEVAAVGAAAVEAVSRGGFDAVLMDVHMPGMDGLTATVAIRALADGKCALPVIALTANALPGDRERYIDNGMNDYVAKPIRVEELSAALSRSTGRDVPIPDFTARAPLAAVAPAPDGGAEVAAFLDQLGRLSEELDKT
jgi:CheY-like chemotaxis protein